MVWLLPILLLRQQPYLKTVGYNILNKCNDDKNIIRELQQN